MYSAQITLWLITVTVIKITTGAICISEVLGKCSLQVLDMSENIIGDDGITAIAGTLNNSQICELNINWCGITLSGARSLAAGLLVNSSVRKLDMLGNPITVEGAHLILQSAVVNGVCQQVVIYNILIGKQSNDKDYLDDEEVKKMMILLKLRKKSEIYEVACCDSESCHDHCNRSYNKVNDRSRVGISVSLPSWLLLLSWCNNLYALSQIMCTRERTLLSFVQTLFTHRYYAYTNDYSIYLQHMHTLQ